MENPVVLIVLMMVFATIVLGLQAAWFYIKGRRDEELEKIRHRLGVSSRDDEEDVSSLLRDQAADSAIEALGNMGEELRLTIQQAGMQMTVSTLVTYMGIAFFTVFLGGTIYIGSQAILPAFCVGYLPLWWVRRRARKRADQLLSQMPDALEMMGRAMQTGAGLSDCFRLVQEEMPEPIATEFGTVSDAVRFGKEWRLAMEELIGRNPTLFELRLLVSSILLQRETGGNMIETVTRIAKLIRQRYAFDAKVKAMTSEARASGFVLAIMPLGVLVLVLVSNASYLEPLWNTALGQIFIVLAVCSYVVGMFLMSSTSQVEV